LRVLFVDEQVRQEGDFLCGSCERRREELGRECRPAPKRRVSIRGLFGFVNDNREVRQ
jgi:hypothetical protein